MNTKKMKSLLIGLGLLTGLNISSAETDVFASSWDRVPVNFHLGQTKGDLSDADIEFLASYNSWVVLEKSHGSKVHGSTEAGIAYTAKRLKEKNPNVKVFFYLNAFINWPGYDAYKTYQPEWDLRGIHDGEVILKNRTTVPRPDLSNPEFREWWSDTIAAQMKTGDLDGVFVDALPQVLGPDWTKLLGEEKAQAIIDGAKEMLILAKKKMGPNKVLLANGTRGERYREILDWEGIDGVMIEHFDAFSSNTPEIIKADLETLKLAADKGKFAIIKGWPGFFFNDPETLKRPKEELLQEARENITFPLACFLIGVQPGAQFCYSWGYRSDHGMLESYLEFEKPLGKPESDAVWDGFTATRKFEHLSVWIDLKKKEARIDWH